MVWLPDGEKNLKI